MRMLLPTDRERLGVRPTVTPQCMCLVWLLLKSFNGKLFFIYLILLEADKKMNSSFLKRIQCPSFFLLDHVFGRRDSTKYQDTAVQDADVSSLAEFL